MKTFFLAIILSISCITSNAQKMNDKNLNDRIIAIEDRVALKNLVDIFSTLADQKDIEKQILLFTDDATVDTYIGGKLVTSLKGRKQIGETFTNFLNLFETVYHINGQQTVTINGNTASGISYCLVTLIGVENGKKMRTTNGVYYNDEYVKENGKWLIAKRKSTFAYQDKQEVSQ